MKRNEVIAMDIFIGSIIVQNSNEMLDFLKKLKKQTGLNHADSPKVPCIYLQYRTNKEYFCESGKWGSGNTFMSLTRKQN